MGEGRAKPVRWWPSARLFTLCVALAVVTTVSVAWVLDNFGSDVNSHRSDFVEHFSGSGAEWVEYEWSGGRECVVHAPRMGLAEAKRYYAGVPGAGPTEPPGVAALPGPGEDEAITSLRGWPIPCIYHELRRSYATGRSARLVWRPLGPDSWPWLSFGVGWPAALADLAFYTAIIGAALVGLRTWRRSLRREAGHCPSCNYDRRGIDAAAACPECGAGASV